MAPQHDGLRLDVYLRERFRWRSRTWCQRFLEEHLRGPDGRGLRSSYHVRAGERFRLSLPPLPEPDAAVLSTPVPTLFDDGQLLAVDKPAGIAVHPRGRHVRDTVVNMLRARHGPTVDLVHRLDRETSGVLVATRNREMNVALKGAVARREWEKEYWAVVRGAPPADEGEISLPLGRALTSKIRIKVEVRPDGAHAVTEYRVLERAAGHALVSCRPRTGRQHQIRAHLAAIGCPIEGDKIYGVSEALFLRWVEEGTSPDLDHRFGHSRHALHARRLRFRHPVSGEPLEIVSPLPEDLLVLWRAVSSGDPGHLQGADGGGDPPDGLRAASRGSPRLPGED